MTFSIPGFLAGAALGAGLLLLVISLVLRPGALADRVHKHVATRHLPPVPSRFSIWWRGKLTELLDVVGSTTDSVARRTDVIGRETVADFRVRQLHWAAFGALAGMICGLALIVRGGVVLTALLLTVVGLVGGLLAADSRLTREAHERSESYTHELPDVVELLALAIGAGESIRTALERITALGSGALHEELERTLTDVRAGESISSALAAMGRRSQNASIERFTDAVCSSIEYGSGLAATLRAQAEDARQTAIRELLDRGGKAEIAMMLPVVFIILPLTVIFTLFPGIAMLDFR